MAGNKGQGWGQQAQRVSTPSNSKVINRNSSKAAGVVKVNSRKATTRASVVWIVVSFVET